MGNYGGGNDWKGGGSWQGKGGGWQDGGWGGGGGKGGGGAAATDSRAISIIGEVRSRLSLKNEMERFGRVEICYMGNRHNPSADPPWVRFEKATSAQAALTAINAGQV